MARRLPEKFDWCGLIDPHIFEAGLARIASLSPTGCRLALLWPPFRNSWNIAHEDLELRARVIAFREARQRIADRFDFVRAIDVETCIPSEAEVVGEWHFDRLVYFRFYKLLERELVAAESGERPLRTA